MVTAWSSTIKAVAVALTAAVLLSAPSVEAKWRGQRVWYHKEFHVKNDPEKTIKQAHAFLESRHIPATPDNIKYITPTTNDLIIVIYWYVDYGM